VFQNYALYPHMTVAENLGFALRMRKMAAPEIRRRVAAAAEVLGLTPHLAKRPRELSGGERQRVALGRAMVREPRVFLFDEPLSNLDARLRVEMRAEIRALHRRVGATMLYVTHDQVEAMTMGDRIAVLRGGLLQQCADPRTLYARPANTFVASFIGSPPMNLLEARVALDGHVVVVEGVRMPVGDVQRAILAERGVEKFTIGVRPEDLLTGGAPDALPAAVDHVEPLGSETLVHWTSAAGRLVSRVTEGRLPAPGEHHALTARPDAVLLFADATGEALLPEEAGAATATR
jgi:multiple sugar transport system ATP-binding protein